VVEPGGAQLAVLRLTDALRAHGVRTDNYAGVATRTGRELFRRVRLETWNGEPHMQYAASERFADWLRPRLRGADVVHGHMFGGWWAATRAAPPGAVVVGTEHNALRWPGKPLLREMRETLPRVDLFFAAGPSAARLVLNLGLPPQRLREWISPIASAFAAGVSGLPLPRLVYAGRLHDEKGVDLLLEALALMRTPPPTYVLGDGPAASPLQRLAHARGIARLVRFTGWRDEPARWIAGATACVVPSRHEAWSQTAVLAMSLGVPVVATAVEGLPTTLARGRGVLVAPDDPTALAVALDDVVAGRRLPDLAAARAYSRRFAVGHVAAYHAAVYRELLEPPLRAAG
jgi:glycosyltransferase involved in cell wall biosynthesis